MREFNRRGILGLGVGAAAAISVAGCSSSSDSSDSGKVGTKPGQKAPAKPIGDGSTAYTGKQPNQPPAPEKLEPGQKPPQFVVFSWDGAGEVGNGLFPRFRKLAKDHNASMTFFLSGLYLLPEAKKRMYHGPNNPVGHSEIDFLTDAHVKATLQNVRAAWLEGHEIGTHFNGHFCKEGPGSVKHWTPAQWDDEIEQAMSFVTKWRTNTGFTDLEPLPFDYSKELVGGRTPCLLGQDNLLPTARKRGWRYDASSPGGIQVWPTKKQGLWDFPLQGIPFPGRGDTLSMDFNLMFQQSGNATKGPSARYPEWRRQATEAYINGFKRAYESNRAPFFIGNHFEKWNGGIYMDAVEEAFKHMADKKYKDVRLVSFRQLCDWLDAQDPKVLADLRRFGVGQKLTGRS